MKTAITNYHGDNVSSADEILNRLPGNDWDNETRYVTVDNGITGAGACIVAPGDVVCEPVGYRDLGKEKLLSVDDNLALVRRLLEQSGAPPSKGVVIFEQAQIVPLFGVRNNYTNGRNNEFWRVLLTMAKIPFSWVNPKVWQKVVFAGLRGTDTKEMADIVRRQRFPNLDLTQYNRLQIGGINDAICMSLWARQIRL